MSQPYWWFQGATVVQLTERLVTAGPNAILEVRPDGNDLFLSVRQPGVAAAGLAPLNDSHICPPSCATQ